MSTPVERLSSDDLMSLATDSGDTPMQVGAALVLDTGAGFDTDTLVALIERRLPAVPRLRQRLEHPGILGGRPVWIDDPNFRLDDHIAIVRSPTSTGIDELLQVASALVTTRLPRDRPLWSAVIVPNMVGDRTGLVLVYHHVVADGIAGLTVLAALADGSADAPDHDFPRPAPSRTELAIDAARERLSTIRRLPRAIVRCSAAAAQLTPSGITRASRSSLNRPIGGQQRFATVSCDLAAARAAAHAHHVTINDILLSAITGALRRLLAGRGEDVAEFVISVPFSSRLPTDTSLGNQSGAIPLRLPATGSALERLSVVSTITTAEKRTTRGASSAILGPLFRVLAGVGLYQRFVDHQRVVHTFVTNVKGPQSALSVGGFPIIEIVPLSVAVGNITVSFAALSYRGRLEVTIVSDATTCPDLETLRTALDDELIALVGSASLPG